MSAHVARRQAGQERVGLFVDVANLYYATRALGFEMDFAAMQLLSGGAPSPAGRLAPIAIRALGMTAQNL